MISVTPDKKSPVTFGDANDPPVPLAPVTCVPVCIPVPDKGAPIGGVVPVYGKILAPLKALIVVVKVPEEPLLATLNEGNPIAAPV